VNQPKRTRKPGRPKLPRGEAKARIVPVRFAPDDIRAVEAAAKADNQTVSEWIRSNAIFATERTPMEEWKHVLNGKTIKFTYREVGRDQAQMTAAIEGENKNYLEKGGLTLPLGHEDVEKFFEHLLFQKKSK
jgi:hypothetical protein